MTAREVTVEATDRWDAIELLRRLQALRTARTYMIQGAPDRWIVHAQPLVSDAGVVRDVMASVQRWLLDRDLTTCEVHLDGRVEVVAAPESR